MNLHWHRSQQASHAVIGVDGSAADAQPRHWAEMTLGQLNIPDDLAQDIRLAFPDRDLAEAFEIFDIFHVPGRSLKILGRFIPKQETGASTTVQVDFFSETEVTHEMSLAKERAIDPNRVVFIESWNAVARIFPEDPGLPGLDAMLDITKVAKLLGETGTDPNQAGWKLLSYQSGKRCALGYHFSGGGRRYFGKIQDGKGAGTTHDYLSLLWNSPTRRFQMPEPIAFDPSLGARWESFVDGQNLEKALETGELEPLVRLVVSNLLFLHEQDLPGLPTATAGQILARIEKKILRRMQSLTPELAIWAEKITQRLNDTIPWTQNTGTVTLHGDFHIANFILNEKGLVFIDLDSLCKGDPCADLALFGSRLILRNLHHGDRLPETLALVAQLPALYVELGGIPIRQETFAWFLSALLIGRQIKACMSVDAPEKTALMARLLNWAEESLNNPYETVLSPA